MPFILGIDTAGPRGSIALAENGAAGDPVPLPEGGHSSGLAAAVERLLSGSGVRVPDLAGIAVSEGPGSFTGLRIGLALAKGVAMGAAIPLALVPAHDAAAHAARRAAPRFATLTQAERGQVMAALWEGCVEEGDDRARLLWGPEAVPEEEVLDRVLERAGSDVPVAAATEALEEWVLDLGGTILPARPLGPAIAELGAVALASGLAADPREAEPLYGRAPNARKPAPR